MSTEEQYSETGSTQTIAQFLASNKNNLLIAGIALILLAGGIYYYSNSYKPAIESEANESLFTAERYYNQDSLDKALNGDGLHLGMIDIADDFGSTNAGNRASYYAGRILLEKGQFQEALDYFSKVSMKDELMAAQVLTLQGDCHSEMEKYEIAANMYMKAANIRKNNLTTPYALIKAGIAFEEAGELNAAIKAFEQLRDDYPSERLTDKIEVRIARVEAKLSAK